MLFLLLLLMLFALIIATFYFKRYRAFKDVNLKGPFPYPLIGNILIINNKFKILPNIFKMGTIYGKDLIASIGPNNYLVVRDAETVGFIMNSFQFNEKDVMYKLFRGWLETGLLTSHGKKWIQRRKVLTPTFHFKILINFVETFERMGEIFVNKIAEKADGKTSFDVYNMTTLFTLDVICETAMGITVNAQLDSKSEYVTNVRTLLNMIASRGFSIPKYFDYLYMLFPSYWKETALIKKLHATTYKIIAERRAKQLEFNKDNCNKFGIKQKIAFLDMLLKSTIDGKLLSDDDIREEVDTFLFEGHDTTASGISFGLYELSKNPEVQNKILEEQNAIFLGEKRQATYDDLQQMTYLESVMKEVLRLYPPVPMFGRVIREDIKFDKGTLKSGTGFFIIPYGMHRDPDYFPDPEKFKPERFAVENLDQITPFSYVPFSAGQRNCIGQKFAILEFKSVVSKIIRNFELLPDPTFKPAIAFEMNLKSANGLNIRVKKKL